MGADLAEKIKFMEEKSSIDMKKINVTELK